MCALSNPHLSFAAGFGTFAFRQVAGFHRAVPSTALDKASMQFQYILQVFLKKSRHFSFFFLKNVYKSDIDFFLLSC